MPLWESSILIHTMNQVGVVGLWCFWLGKFMHWTWGRAKQLCLLKNSEELRDFPGSPVVKTPSSQCRWPGFDPWPWNLILHAQTKTWCSQKKKKKKKWGILSSQEAERTTLEAGVGKRAPTENRAKHADSGGKKSWGRSGCGSGVCVCVCVCACALNIHSHPLLKTHQDIVSKVRLARWWWDFF